MSEARNAKMTGLPPYEGKGWFRNHGILTGKFVNSVFQAPWIYHLLKPRITGNEINGLGETKFRRASKAYHWLFSESKNYPFLWINWLFILRSQFAKKFGYNKILKRTLDLMDETRKLNKEQLPQGITGADYSLEQWGQIIKEKAREFGAGDVGLIKITEEMLFEGKPAPGKYAIMIAVPMDYLRAHKIPHLEGNCETLNIYRDTNEVTLKLARWLRSQGVLAMASHILPEKFILIPAAIKSGLGQLGKHGSLIHPRFGSLVRLGYVAVDMKLPEDRPIEFCSDEFCMNCQVCIEYCPPQAIFADKQMLRGTSKWYVDFDKCVPYFNDSIGCGRCLAVCPWSLPGVAENMLDKLSNQKEKLVFAAEMDQARRQQRPPLAS